MYCSLGRYSLTERAGEKDQPKSMTLPFRMANVELEKNTRLQRKKMLKEKMQKLYEKELLWAFPQGGSAHGMCSKCISTWP